MITSLRAKNTFLVAFLLALAVSGSLPRSRWPAHFTMTDTTIRQQFVDKLKLKLARISIANGFKTDIGASLQTAEALERVEWPVNLDEPDIREETLFGIFDRETDQSQSFPREKQIGNVMLFQVRIYHARQTTPAELRIMIGDVEKAVIENESNGQRDPQWQTWDQTAGAYLAESALATDTKPLRSGFVMASDVFTIEAGAVEFQVEYLTEPFNAYC